MTAYRFVYRSILVLLLWVAAPAQAAMFVPLDLPETLEKQVKNFNPSNFELAQTEAAQGNAYARLLVGLAYAQGEAYVENEKRPVQDFASAKINLRQAAEEGNADAQFALARLYSTGGVLFSPVPGLKDDFHEAEKWYLAAAQQGHILAQTNLGDMYSKARHFRRNALDFPENYPEAIRWYRAAADQDYLPAQFALAGLYAQGQGVPQDFHEALNWYEKVVHHTDSEKYRNEWGLVSRAQKEVARMRRELAAPAFRNHLKVGDVSSEGEVLEVASPRAKIRSNGIPPVERWVSIDNLYPAAIEAGTEADK